MLAKPARRGILIEHLLQPEAYPHEVTELRLLETHISWVILTGPYAYKIKKPVRFDFVDYSSLSERQRFCELELALNRRFAPELYINVVPIYEIDGRPRVAPGSVERSVRPVEYAVQMQQFPQSAIVAARLEHPQLTAAAVEQFGRDIARFHATVDVAPGNLECVQVERIAQDALENFHVLGKATEQHPGLQDLQRLERWTVGQLERLRPKFANRLSGGFIRRCHGDMHLQNVLQLDGRLIPFDGIEFNEEFQWIDVASELAFPVMDFVARGRADLGWRLLNAWLESSGDYGGAAVLRFYLVYRALVRAKVTWLNPHNRQRSPGQAEAEPWDQYLDAARYFAFEMQPELSIMHGLSGSGKSTAAMQWVERHGGIRMRSDVQRNRLAGESATVGKYSPEMSEHVYGNLLDAARSIIDAGFPVIVDATFIRRAWRLRFRQLADQLGTGFRIIDCDAPLDVLGQRIRQRRADPSEATIDVLQMQMKSRDPLTADESRFVTKIN